MKRLFITFALLVYAGMAVYSIGKMKTASSAIGTTPRQPEKATQQIRLAVNNLPTMINFYNEVFDADLQPEAPAGQPTTGSYQGNLHGLELVLRLKQAGTNSAERRFPIKVAVTDIAKTLARVAIAGGTIAGKVVETQLEKRVIVCDPEGNSIELKQAKG